jgi:hypothetical protein
MKSRSTLTYLITLLVSGSHLGGELLAPRGPVGKGGARDFRMAMRSENAKAACTDLQPICTGYYQVGAALGCSKVGVH